MEVFVPVFTLGALGLIFSIGLVLAYRKLRVEIDPKIEKISEILPQANCGACGYAGCQAFAEAVVDEKVAADGCPVGGKEVADQVADILGVKAKEVIKKVARLHCRGTLEAAKDRGAYRGLTTCYASHLIGGNKQCTHGCLHSGDCVIACPFDAMYMSEEGLPVVIEDNCTACGICVDACPRNLLELHPVSQEIIVFCRSLDRGAVARKVCKNACIACGICARACPEAIVMENNLAKITDYKKIDPKKIPEIEKCPTDAIGRLEKQK
ncbi:electron transporter RnfB [candidate division WOR-1 bacterium DG_54_3]|uniref:Ion-translocating oxidoreductase complex subunit B n=1 Tax=candidate division WOR-1 bacterium DG_54_3 TaxID=1703775 RepID=A0A0S7Y627_UNCSA|nr:MAG: electron transporter RnfB [candidate division WOR-1 bacterium DG_54_3]